MTDLLSPVQSPCIGGCCLDDNEMCLGCFRMMDEILTWHSADPKQQHAVIRACATRKLEKSQRDLS